MFCNQCGTQLADGTQFCSNCGAKQDVAAVQEDLDKTVGVFQNVPVAQPVQQPVYQAPAQPAPQQPVFKPAPQQPVYQAPIKPAPQQPNPAAGGHNGKVSFGEAIKLFFTNYVNFTGRASKSEFWWAFLFTVLVSLVTSWIPVVGQLVMLGVFLPTLSIAIRRLHDIGKPWPYYLMGLIPFAGFIIMIVYYCKDSVGDNQWGPGPVANGYAPQYTAPVYTAPAAPKVITDNTIIAMAQQREPVNVNTPEAKRTMDAALARIVPNYTGMENLAGAMMLCDPQTIKQNISATDTETLFVIYKALGYYMAQGGDANVLGMVQQNVMATLKTRF